MKKLVKVHLEDGDFIITEMNGTENKIRKYLNQTYTKSYTDLEGRYQEKILKIVAVEFV